MHIVAVAWLFVVLLMTAAEATSPQGTVLGALFTLLLYGLLPLGLVLYLMGTPARRQARLRQEALATAQDLAATKDAQRQAPNVSSDGPQADAGGHAAGDPVAPEREKA